MKANKCQSFNTLKVYFLFSAQMFAGCGERAQPHIVIQEPRLLPSKGSIVPQWI